MSGSLGARAIQGESMEWAVECARKVMFGHPDPRKYLVMPLDSAGRINQAVGACRIVLQITPAHQSCVRAPGRRTALPPVGRRWRPRHSRGVRPFGASASGGGRGPEPRPSAWRADPARPANAGDSRLPCRPSGVPKSAPPSSRSGSPAPHVGDWPRALHGLHFRLPVRRAMAMGCRVDVYSLST